MRKGQYESLGSGGRVIHYGLLIGNCVLAVFACFVIGIGIYISAEKLDFVAAVFGTELITTSSYLLMSAGCAMFALSFVGCFGALYGNKTLLIVYAVVLSIAFVISLTAFSMAIVFRSWITDQIRTYMRKTLQEDYGTGGDWGDTVTSSWDMAQERWYCCAVEDSSWGVYRSSVWYSQQPGISEVDKAFVPLSCCKKDQYGLYVHPEKCQFYNSGPPGKQTGGNNEALLYRGCYDVGKDYLYYISGYLIGVGLTLAILMATAIIFATWYALHL